MLSIFIKDKKADFIRSISYMKKNLYKCWEINFKNVLKLIIKNNTTFKEPYNAPRQSLSNFYYQNGVYDILRTRILKKNLISGKKILGFFTKENVDIDNYNDLKNVEKFKKNFINFRKYIKN